jgi:hypothetical protein
VTRILGIDPGLATLGFGVIDTPSSQGFESGVTVIDFGVISTPAKTPVGERLCTIYDDLHSLIDQFQPDQVVIETFFFYRMGNTKSKRPSPANSTSIKVPVPMTPLMPWPWPSRDGFNGRINSNRDCRCRAPAIPALPFTISEPAGSKGRFNRLLKDFLKNCVSEYRNRSCSTRLR